jgi:hypothetical protein
MAEAARLYGCPSASMTSPKIMIVMTGARNGAKVERGRVRPSQSGGRTAAVEGRKPDRGCGTGLCLLAWLDRRLERPSAANPSSVWPPRPSGVPATVIRSGSPILIESDAQP